MDPQVASLTGWGRFGHSDAKILIRNIERMKSNCLWVRRLIQNLKRLGVVSPRDPGSGESAV
jgi:hypothetical protein